MTRFVAYYRVWTDKQGVRGLGVDAQREAVARYLDGHVAGRGALAAEFVEVESGARDARPQLAAALDACQRERATLLIAKLDRLARRVSFIAALMERPGLTFVAVEYPDAPPLLLHMLAASAEHERKAISERTRAAMAAANARGRAMGSPKPEVGLAAARAVHDARRAPVIARALPVATRLRAEGRTLRAIAAELTAAGVPTARGGRGYAGTVRTLLRAHDAGARAAAVPPEAETWTRRARASRGRAADGRSPDVHP
jgi:DNA invertase Pin-like site-specific DNA recombinase